MYFKSKLHPRSKTLAATNLNLTYNLQLLSITKILLPSESAEVLRKQNLGLREPVYMLEEAKSLRIASDICRATFETGRKGCQSSAVVNMHAWSLSMREADVVRVGLCCAGLSWRCGKEGSSGVLMDRQNLVGLRESSAEVMVWCSVVWYYLLIFSITEF